MSKNASKESQVVRREKHKGRLFDELAAKVARWTGRPVAFAVALIVIIVWGVTGPIFQYSDTWQLIINTSTTIATFLVVFLIQNTQNHDSRALHLKLDELIRAIRGARNQLVELEDLSDEELERLHREFHELRARYADHVQRVSEEVGRRKASRR